MSAVGPFLASHLCQVRAASRNVIDLGRCFAKGAIFKHVLPWWQFSARGSCGVRHVEVEKTLAVAHQSQHGL